MELWTTGAEPRVLQALWCTMPQPLPLVFTRANALAAGYSIGQINRRINSGAWVTLRRGAYAEQARLVDPDREDVTTLRVQELARIAAALVVSGRDTLVSDRAARFLYRLPEAMRPGDSVTLVAASRRTHGSRRDGVTVTPASVPSAHRTTVQGLRALTKARLAVDALRTEELAEALMVGDGALRAGATKAEIESVLGDCAGWPGVVDARTRAALLDVRHESPLESASVAMFVERDLPLPEPQVEIWHEGRLLGRADFGWLEQRVLGEADGKTKYVDDLPGAPPPEERVWSQRLRQADFEDIGWEVTRWTDSERRLKPDLVERRIRTAFVRAERLRLTG
jgi:hypothetical protein